MASLPSQGNKGDLQDLGWAEMKWGEGLGTHLLCLCDNSYVPMERVDQVLDRQLFGEVCQVDVVFTVIAAEVEMEAKGAQARPLEDICFPWL